MASTSPAREALDVGDRVLAAHLEPLLLDEVDEVRLGVNPVGRHPRVAHQLQQLAPSAPRSTALRRPSRWRR